ncbi:MAG: PhzF family phenazine biosynthesis protein [Thermosynechococcaceae cyanobacterium MS004]|nr:PhzF family phenazine biosynthesis protein [Thermosynechococcaceae cyanobacterium MS004]
MEPLASSLETHLETHLETYWVDAFADQPFQGNPAVVVPQADGLSDFQMQQIAREVNCSETAFVLTASTPEADFRLRWFTPTQEVDLCGHATIAALHALAQAGRFNLSRGVTHILYLETRSGILPVTVDWSEPRPWIWLTLPDCRFDAIAPDLAQQLAQVLGLPTPSAVVLDSLNQDVFLPIPHLHQLHALSPNMGELAQLGKQQKWRGVCVYSTETVDSLSQAHSRFFAPQSGISEDPVTGSMSGPLALLLRQQLEVDSNSINIGLPENGLESSPESSPEITAKRQIWRFEQGDCLGRAGRLLVDLKGHSPKLGGQAITVMRGVLYL